VAGRFERATGGNHFLRQAVVAVQVRDGGIGITRKYGFADCTMLIAFLFFAVLDSSG
jgi:hypothetical protein